MNMLKLYIIVNVNSLIYEQFTNKNITFSPFYMPPGGVLKRIYRVL